MKIKTFYHYSSDNNYSALDREVNAFIADLQHVSPEIKANYFNGALVYTVIY